MVSCYGLAFSGGFTNSLLAMDWNSYLLTEGGASFPGGSAPESAFGHPPSPLPPNVIQPTIGRLIGFMAVIYFIGEHNTHSCWAVTCFIGEHKVQTVASQSSTAVVSE